MAKYPSSGDEQDAWRFPDASGALLRQLFRESRAERWHLSFQSFQSALVRSVVKRFGAGLNNPDTPGRNPDAAVPITTLRIEEYVLALHVQDIALACACLDGSEAAWNDFVGEYRGYLRSAAAAILRRPASDSAVIELADSLFADLYGLKDGKAGGRSLFHYFHGRSSLKTWLRAVLAQRHIDSIRAGKKFDSLDDGGENCETRRAPELGTLQLPADPHREMYLERFREALTLALGALDAHDRSRLRLYYAEERTLAEIGKELGEHESSVSRNLERIRKELRETVRGLLGAGKPAANGGPALAGMDEAQIELSMQYAGEDALIDLDKLFESRKKNMPGPDRILEP